MRAASTVSRLLNASAAVLRKLISVCGGGFRLNCKFYAKIQSVFHFIAFKCEYKQFAFVQK